MKTLAAALVLALAVPLFAAEPITLAAGESRTFQMMGASAAWPIDAAIVDAAAQDGRVTLFGRAAGKTRIMVVSITGENALEVIVTAPARAANRPTQGQQAARATAEVRYNSAAREVQNSVTVRGEKSEANVRVVHLAAPPAGERAQTSVATAYYRLFDRNRELTIFDRDVDHSPLTLRNTPLRGIHYVDEHWRLHAGYTAYATYQSFFIPIDRQLVLGGGYAFRTGARSKVTPTLFTYPGEGTVASVLHDYRDGDRLATRTELAYSRGLGAAAEISYAAGRDRVRAEARYRGEDFAVTGPASPRGFFGDASWTRAYGRGSSLSMIAAATDTAGMRVLAATADVDHRLNDTVSLLGGATWGSFDGRRSYTIPAGVRLDLPRGGVTALYRYTQSGHGFRLSGRASLGRVYLSAFADRQENAPTLDLIFGERPDLALALDELGIAATSPADIARALREHASLIELGLIEGVTIDFAPVRTQVGFDLALLGTGASRQQLRARVLHNVIETFSTQTATTIASLSYSRRITASTDVFASYAYWRTERRGQEANIQPVVEAGVRQRLDGFGGGGSGSISGIVFADEDLDGRNDGTGVAAMVELDGKQSVETAPDGSFTFNGIARGSHQLVAHIPDRPHAYFTTPSRVEANTGEKVAFGVATTPAWLNGRVVSDAGTPVGGVRLRLARGAKQTIVATGDDGRFSFAAAPGEWELSLLGESVPAGYSMAEGRTVALQRDAPAEVELALRAHRTVNGSGVAPNAVVDVNPHGRTVRADGEGRFLVRSLPAGETTLVSGGVEKRVVLPRTPATISVQFGEAAPAPAPDGEWLVMLGAYRVAGNATQTVTSAAKLGVAATTHDRGSLTIVRSGPYLTREAAGEVAARLRRNGVEAVVVQASGN